MVISTFLAQINYISLFLLLTICRNLNCYAIQVSKMIKTYKLECSKLRKILLAVVYVGFCYSRYYSDQF